MTGTHFPTALLAAAVASSLTLVAGCFSDGTDEPFDAGVPDTGTGAPDAAPTCVPRAEICNGLDDDCDGIDDAADPDAQTRCGRVVVNTTTFCSQVRTKWLCVPGACNPGFEQCDGDPSNGCEPQCACNECPDAAM